jgi:hypothetical protein
VGVALIYAVTIHSSQCQTAECVLIHVDAEQAPGELVKTLAASALGMLARLFRYGRLGHHGGFLNASTGQMTALSVDLDVWTRARTRHRRSLPSGQ